MYLMIKHAFLGTLNNIDYKIQRETLRVVTIAMICFTLLHFQNFNTSGGLHITQLNIYDGAFIAKIESP